MLYMAVDMGVKTKKQSAQKHFLLNPGWRSYPTHVCPCPSQKDGGEMLQRSTSGLGTALGLSGSGLGSSPGAARVHALGQIPATGITVPDASL